MIIKFNHGDQLLYAEVTCDLTQKHPAVIVSPEDFTSDLGEEILFINVNNDWNCNSDIQKRFPETYTNILNAINNKFRKDRLIKEVYLQNFLS